MTTQAFEYQIPESFSALIHTFGISDIDPELMFPQPCGYIWMSGRVDVRVYAHRYTSLYAAPCRQRIQQSQLRFGLAVEAPNLMLQRVVEFLRGLADARKYHAR